MSLRLRLLVLFAAVLFVGAGCGSTSSYAAIVDGKRISQKALDEELEAIAGNAAYRTQLEQQGAVITGTGKGTFDTAFVAQVLNRQILLEIVHQEFERRELNLSDADTASSRETVQDQTAGAAVFEEFSKNYQDTLTRRNAEVVALQAAMAEKPITDEAVAEFYEANKAELFAETCVSHILLSPQTRGETPSLDSGADASALIAEANRLKARIARGEEFAKVAGEASKDQTSESGGSLGCVGPGNFVPEFETTMETLEPGQVSDPVRTQFGIHLILVTERKVQTLDEAEDQVRQRLLAQAQGDFQTWLLGQTSELKIEVNPRYGRFSAEGESPRVIPPDRPTTTTADATDPAPTPGGPTDTPTP
ncbi:MAG: foldase protein PrsA [Acidimicrobiales bacterium]